MYPKIILNKQLLQETINKKILKHVNLMMTIIIAEM
jgi:hypothetical protein